MAENDTMKVLIVNQNNEPELQIQMIILCMCITTSVFLSCFVFTLFFDVLFFLKNYNRGVMGRARHNALCTILFKHKDNSAHFKTVSADICVRLDCSHEVPQITEQHGKKKKKERSREKFNPWLISYFHTAYQSWYEAGVNCQFRKVNNSHTQNPLF